MPTTIQVPEQVSRALQKFPGTKGETVERLLELTEGNTRTLSFSETVPPETKTRFVEDIPIDGNIVAISVQFPSGTNFLVGVRVSVESTSIFPSRGFLEKDGFEEIYQIDHSVRRGQNIYIEIRNADDTHPHEITLDAVIVGGPE